MYRLDAKRASNCNFFDSQTSNLPGDYRDLLVSNVAFQTYMYHMDPRVNLRYCQKRMNEILKSVNLLFVSAPNKNNVFAVFFHQFSSFFCVRKCNQYFNTFFYAAPIVSGSFSNQVFLLILRGPDDSVSKMQAHVSGKPDFYWERFEIISTHWQFLKTCQNGYFLGFFFYIACECFLE